MQKQGFTLIEIIIAVTILSFIMVSVFGIYSNIIALNKRLAVSRSLQENARNITEIIAKDIRENGIAFGCYNHTAASSSDCPWVAGNTEYAGSGSRVLITKVAPADCPGGGSDCFVSYYLMHDNLASLPSMCQANDTDCYLWRELPDGQRIRITDKSVKLDNLKFFISGVDSKTFASNTDSEGKVTLSFLLAPAAKQGLSTQIIESLTVPIQTTITEKLYKAR